MSERYLLVLWLTGRCNLKCRYCYASENDKPQDMTFSTAKKVIDKFGDHPVKIQFAGGEPLLNFSLAEEICQYVREKGMDATFQLQTNGTLLDESIIGKLKRYSISTGVSLDGVPEINDMLRGKTRQVIDGIRMMGMDGMKTSLNAVVTGLNAGRLHDLVDLAYYLGNVGGIGLDILRYAGRGKTNKNALSPSPEQLRKALIRMYDRSAELNSLFGFKVQIREVEDAKRRLLKPLRNTYYCYASLGRSVVVLPDGRIYPCGSLLSDEFYMGCADNIRTEEFIRLINEGNEGCQSCKYDAYCPKGCPSRQICNQNSLDCVLMRTAFELAESEIKEKV